MNETTRQTQMESSSTLGKVKASLEKRKSAEIRFQALCLASISAALLILVILLVNIISNALPALRSTFISLDVYLDPQQIENVATGNYDACVKTALASQFPDVKDRQQKNALKIGRAHV